MAPAVTSRSGSRIRPAITLAMMAAVEYPAMASAIVGINRMRPTIRSTRIKAIAIPIESPIWMSQIGLSIGIAIAFILVLLIVGLILFIPTIALAIAGYSTAAIIASVIAGLILLPLLLVVAGAIGTFSHAYWTLAYLRLTTPPTSSPSPDPSPTLG